MAHKIKLISPEVNWEKLKRQRQRHKKKQKQYYILNKDRIREYAKEWRKKNKKRIKEYSQIPEIKQKRKTYEKEYRTNEHYKEYQKKYSKIYQQTDHSKKIKKLYYQEHKLIIQQKFYEFCKTDKGKIYLAKTTSKRRQKKWIQILPNIFPKDIHVDFHHIDGKIFVVPIPKKLHLSVSGGNIKNHIENANDWIKFYYGIHPEEFLHEF